MKVKRLEGQFPEDLGHANDEDDEIQPGLLMHEDFDDFLHEMMSSAGSDLGLLPNASMGMSDGVQQQMNSLPLQVQASNGYGVGGYLQQQGGGVATQLFGAVQMPALLPQQQQQLSLQQSTVQPVPIALSLVPPQSLTASELQQPVGAIHAAINLRKRPMQPGQRSGQQLADADYSMLTDTKPPSSIFTHHASSIPDSPTGGTVADDALEDRSERKRIKNAQLARENREKKKQHVQELESRANVLAKELAQVREREANLSAELSSAKRQNNYLLSVLYRQSELAAFLSTVPALGGSQERRLQLRQQPNATPSANAATRDTDSQTTGGICLHIDSGEVVSVVLCERCAGLGGAGGGGGGLFVTAPLAILGGSSQTSSLSSL